MRFKFVVAVIALASAAVYFVPKRHGDIRVATYNIKYLKADDNEDRISALKGLISKVDADVWGLQEIKDRAALERIFDPIQWHIVIDDDSGDNQDLALVVKKPLKILGNLNAGDDDFLFPDRADNTFFPNRRDVLHVRVEIPGSSEPVSFMVVHAKSRYGGRDSTEPRRVGASKALVAKLKSEFAGKPYVLLGDMNDNPDDQSLNILETGNPNAVFETEISTGSFLVNLTEPLAKKGLVTNSLEKMKVDRTRGIVINTDPESRSRNAQGLRTNRHTGNILFDQILVSNRMHGAYVEDSVAIFNGIENLGCSDHLPVYADFRFGSAVSKAKEGNASGVRIAELVPNPSGFDAGKEQLTIENTDNKKIEMTDWYLVNKSGDKLPLKGYVEANNEVIISIPRGNLPLDNAGDSISLFDSEGTLIHRVEYDETQSGGTVSFR